MFDVDLDACEIASESCGENDVNGSSDMIEFSSDDDSSSDNENGDDKRWPDDHGTYALYKAQMVNGMCSFN